MRCSVCKRTSDEVKLFGGIFESNMIRICEDCAEKEGVPIIKRPSGSQLDKADKRYSVRERMERMSGFYDKTEINEEELVTQGNLARLRSLPEKQQHEDVMDNYYWNLNMARRRRKISVGALAEEMSVAPEIIRGIEKGILPKDFEQLFVKLEVYLGIKLLKNQTNKINFVRNNREAEREILENVKKKIDGKSEVDEEDEETPEEEVDLDLKKNKKDLFKITISDLVKLKKKKEKAKKEEDEVMGEDLDLEIEEL